ncbi:MAG: exopolysaccharide biosynthesis protein [Oscillospiraceae bacterium]|jgi:exopolysaccharide biosynthesis protein|nr:exopolysaccharide biosynthesis protein [Oscillospiraceae bacterium]
MSKKLKIIFSSAAAFIIVVGFILYLLANRYLIEHIEKEVVSSSQTEVQSSNGSAASEEKEDTDKEASSEAYTADDMNYVSDTKSISIKKITKGTGQDIVTYYVADVKLTSGTDLQAALAKNKFGTNITQYTSVIAQNNDAIFAINGDYYGFRNDGVVIRNGVLYRNIPARTGLAIYKDGSMRVYDETKISAAQLLKDGVYNTYSFGPAILQDGTIPTELDSVEVDTNFGNHSIQGNQPRTGVGIIEANHFVFIVADGRSKGYSKGVTLDEFAQIFKGLGCAQAYNMDGGGSSTMYFMGHLINNPLGKDKERGTSDILYVK